MSEGLDKLNSIGAQKIHEQTHIARHHAQAVLHEIFDDMTKIQFLGFISILEREYNVDLNDLKVKGLEFYGDETPKNEDNIEVFILEKEKKNRTALYVVILILIIVVLYILSLSFDSKKEVKVDAIDSTTMENTKVNKPIKESLKSTNNAIAVAPEPEPEPVAVVKSFKIMPKTELWLGYIDLNTYEKYQKLFSDEIALDPKKDWLLHLGHGYVDIEIDGKITQYNDKLNMRFVYKNSKLRKINFEEFKTLNRGKKW